MNRSKYRRTIERMYTDRATIYRHEEVKDPVTKETKLIPQPIYDDQPCRESQSQLAKNQQSDAQNDILYETKLFIAPELVIQQGDLLEVTRGQMTPSGWEPIMLVRKYTAGEPFVYSTHQEISIQRKEWA